MKTSLNSTHSQAMMATFAIVGIDRAIQIYLRYGSSACINIYKILFIGYPGVSNNLYSMV